MLATIDEKKAEDLKKAFEHCGLQPVIVKMLDGSLFVCRSIDEARRLMALLS